MKKDKTFDCVAFQHRAGEQISKGMTIAEELAYWRRYEEEFLLRRQQRQQAELEKVQVST